METTRIICWIVVLIPAVNALYRYMTQDQHSFNDFSSNENRNPSAEIIEIIERKRKNLMENLNKPEHPPDISIFVKRQRIVEDSFNAIMPFFGKCRLHHSRIKVKFIGEEGYHIIICVCKLYDVIP